MRKMKDDTHCREVQGLSDLRVIQDFIDKQGGQRRGLVDKAVEVVAGGVEEFVEHIGEAVTKCEM